MIGTIAASPSSGLKPIARSRSRKCSVWRCSLATSSGSRRTTRTASSAEHATVGGSAFEKSCGRERWARMSHTSSLAATKPPAAPPSALPSVEVIDVHLAEQAVVLRDAAAGVADDSGAVGVVDDERRVVLPHELDDLRQLREVALHREDAVGDHERALPRFQRVELLAQGVHVGVLVDRLARGLREPDRVDDRRVVQLVGEDHRVLVGQARNRGLVRVPARHVGERGLGADEIGELALQLEVRLERAADEAHATRCPRRTCAAPRSRPRPPPAGRRGRGSCSRRARAPRRGPPSRRAAPAASRAC